MLIQWYPGHMAKARRMLIENLKLIDAVVEIVDARAPAATRNPDFDALFCAKRRVVLLNKSDLAAPEVTKAFIRAYQAQGIEAMEMVSTVQKHRASAIALMERAVRPEVERLKAKGVHKTVRVMVVGIPNVGKSTFINRIAGTVRAQVGDKPGVTKARQWVKITPYLELMDTPGLLWPKLENERLARHLAYIGSIKDDIMDVEQLAGLLLQELANLSPGTLVQRYAQVRVGAPPHELLEGVCESRNFLLPGGLPNIERAARIVLDEFRAGKIGRVTLDAVEDMEAAHGAH
ncbi:MAG: ribosome biogenesis GTPase YlqF [Christensenellaceae bacterium]|nr:ribosome biogenesis GTPase YlqF [Christensenellaceae bacterium]